MHYRIDKAQNIVLAKIDQDFTFDELLAHLKELLQDKDFVPGMNGLYDFSLVEHVTGDLQALLATAETMEDDRQVTTPANVAIVVQHQNHNLHKIFQGYCIMASDSLVQYQLFTLSTYDEALAYVGLTAKPEFKNAGGN